MKLLLIPIVAIFFVISYYVPQRPNDYYTGDYPVSCNLYSFNSNIQSWLKNRTNPPPIDTISAVRWAKQAGFDSVNIPMYYIPGYEGTTMPSQPTDKIREYIHQVKQTAAELGLVISGTGIGNNFANSNLDSVEMDVKRALFWIDMAAELGAPFVRVFSGPVPSDLDQQGGWAALAQSRIVPALKTITEYGATKNVKIGLQNHGDMTATADQTIQILHWVNNPNIFIVDDTGYFRPFQAPDGLNYDWYTDINKVLPYSGDLQVKIKPAGAEEDVLMDFNKLFIGVRSSPYREDINLERLWAGNDDDNPSKLPTPPYEQVLTFKAQVDAALEATKIPPSDV